MDKRLTRRESLLRFAGIAAAVGGGTAWKLDRDAEAAGPLAVSTGLVACVLTPELTEGPYYVDGEKLRRDITEGKPGRPLQLALKVVNASNCKLVKNAAVDIWHCDASGAYSGAVANNRGRTSSAASRRRTRTESRRSRRSTRASIPDALYTCT